MFQGDLVIQSALQRAIAALRANDWLLDYCFAGLAQDDDTSDEHGQRAIDLARDWFRKTNIRMVIGPVTDAAMLPCVSIQIAGEQEVERETTLGDVHYQPTEDADRGRPALAGPFIAAYSGSTGTVIVPDAIAQQLVIAEGMSLIDDGGGEHPITKILGDASFAIEPGVTAAMSKATIVGMPASYVTSIESTQEKQTYVLGCHTTGEPVLLIWLHSIVKFCLLMFKERYLEGRGFERSTVSSTDFRPDDQFQSAAPAMVRYISLSGFCRNSWPKDIAQRITSVVFQPQIIGGGRMNSNAQLEDALVLGDQDLDTVAAYGGTTQTYVNPTAPAGSPLVFFGDATPPAVVDDQFIPMLPSEQPAGSRALYLSMIVPQYEYGWVALPARFGTPTAFVNADTSKSIPFSRVAAGVEVYDVGSGARVAYDVWRSDAPGLGSVTVQVR